MISGRDRPMPLARLAAVLIAGCLTAPTVVAEAPGPPLPPARPADLSQPAPSAGEEPAGVPLPPPRPADLGRASAPAAIALPSPSPAEAAPAAALIEHEACLESLARLGVRFEPMSSIKTGACGAERPLRVSSLPEGVQISPPATTTCPVAEALGRWTAEALMPEARRILDRRPVRLQVGTSYECRGQNHAAAARLSEHGFANAVDIGGIAFDAGKPHVVRPLSGEALEGRFQAEIQARACAYFTTVLGPGSDAAHADHFHFDMRGRKGGFRMCQ
jgi:hypothetical protein